MGSAHFAVGAVCGYAESKTTDDLITQGLLSRECRRLFRYDHMHPIVTLLIVVLIFAGAYYLLKPKPLFMVQIRNGQAFATHGKVSRQFLRECERIASMYNLSVGWIKGLAHGKRVSLRFSKAIPREYHQNFRNVWTSMQM